MKDRLIIVLILFIQLSMSGCPHDTSVEPDTNVFLTNLQSDTLRYFKACYFHDNEGDTLIRDVDINYYYSNLSNPKILLPRDTTELYSLNYRYLRKGHYAPVVSFVVNVDTLRNLTPEEVQRTHRGVTKYILGSLDDYEAVGFTLKYPR